MAIRPAKETLTRPAKEREENEPLPEALSQRKRPDIGRYNLQVDRQVKRSFVDLAAAEEAGAALKKKFPLVQIVVYDTVDLTGKTIETAEQA
ncbi:MAG: hypothetical protein WD688_08905 [Candidatus Binatia bacterium]